MKLAAEVDLGEIFQKSKWFCFLTFTLYHLGPADHRKSCFTRDKFGIA